MSDWTDGYTSAAKIDYNFGYYRELNPLRVRTAMLHAGIVCPKIETACELGYGQGISVNFHAGASTTEWWGTDFNPTQAGFAMEMGESAGAKLFDESFEEFCARKDLPDFDFIALHGIFSWISDDSRRSIVELVRQRLKVGGVLYISYNSMPGWAAFAPMRNLMAQHAEIIGAEGRGIISRVIGAMEFSEALLKTNPLYGRTNPSIPRRIERMKDQHREYLAHEYFNRYWEPMHFATMAEWLEPAKMDFGCSATLLDHFDNVNLTREQQEFLSKIPDIMLRQSTRDFMINQQFRRDYWVKGRRQMTRLERSQQFQKQKYVLLVDRADVSMKVSGGQGEVSVNEDIYNAVFDTIADHKPTTLKEMHSRIKGQKIEFPGLVEAIIVLIGSGQVTPVYEEDVPSSVKKQANRLNDYLIDRARSAGQINFLVSPVTGGGIDCNRFSQLFVGAIKRGKKEPEDMAKDVWETLKEQGQKLVVDKKPLEKDEDNLKELTERAKRFVEKRVPVLKTTQVI